MGAQQPGLQPGLRQSQLPNSAQDFNFSGELGSFTLDDDSNSTHSRKKVITNVAAGTYDVTQAAVPGWSLVSIICPPGSGVDLATGTATLNIASADSITCTFKRVRRRPDASIAQLEIGPYKGANRYRSAPIKAQTQTRLGVVPGQAYDYWVQLQNDGKQLDSFWVKGEPAASPYMTVTFLAGNVDVTTDVLAGSYSTGPLNPAAVSPLVVHVVVAPDAPFGSTSKVIVRATSAAEPSAVDVVRAVTTH